MIQFIKTSFKLTVLQKRGRGLLHLKTSRKKKAQNQKAYFPG